MNLPLQEIPMNDKKAHFFIHFIAGLSPDPVSTLQMSGAQTSVCRLQKCDF